MALQISPENIDKFDKSIIDLDIRFFLFSNRDFKNIIRYSKKLNIRIRSIETEDTDEEFNEEINVYIENRDYDNLIKFIDENHIIIKTLDLFFNGQVVKIYDSGIFWTDIDLSVSKKPNPLLKSIVDILPI